MSDKTSYGVVRLCDEDRARLDSVIKGIGAAGKGKPAATGKPKPPAEDELEDGLDGDAGAGDGDEGDDGLGGDGDDGLGDEPEPVTRNDVQAALREYAGVSNKAAAIKLMTDKGGADALSKLKEGKFAAVITAAKAATAKAKKAAK